LDRKLETKDSAPKDSKHSLTSLFSYFFFMNGIFIC
jgi:hypothetical protein